MDTGADHAWTIHASSTQRWLRGHATHTSPSGEEDRRGAPRLANDRARHQLQKTQDRVLHFFCGR